MLVFLSIGSRRIEYVACASNPDTAWMLQQARNLLMDLDDRGQRPRFLIHDRDTKFSAAFDPIFASEGITVIRTPVQAPNANAHMERWVGSARRELLDRILIVGHRHLDYILRIYVRHYNRRRPHRALELQAPDPISVPVAQSESIASLTAVRRHDLLGGLIHEYELVVPPHETEYLHPARSCASVRERATATTVCGSPRWSAPRGNDS